MHHILFGGGIGGVGLVNPASPLGNALAFFICGLPGGIDYGMLAAVKEGLLSSEREKFLNTKLNVWMRAPGLTMVAYAIYISWRHHKPAPLSGPASTLVSTEYKVTLTNHGLPPTLTLTLTLTLTRWRAWPSLMASTTCRRSWPTRPSKRPRPTQAADPIDGLSDRSMVCCRSVEGGGCT